MGHVLLLFIAHFSMHFIWNQCCLPHFSWIKTCSFLNSPSHMQQVWLWSCGLIEFPRLQFLKIRRSAMIVPLLIKLFWLALFEGFWELEGWLLTTVWYSIFPTLSIFCSSSWFWIRFRLGSSLFSIWYMFLLSWYSPSKSRWFMKALFRLNSIN